MSGSVDPMTPAQIEELRRITEDVGPGITGWLSSGRTLALIAAYDEARRAAALAEAREEAG